MEEPHELGRELKRRKRRIEKIGLQAEEILCAQTLHSKQIKLREEQEVKVLEVETVRSEKLQKRFKDHSLRLEKGSRDCIIPSKNRA